MAVVEGDSCPNDAALFRVSWAVLDVAAVFGIESLGPGTVPTVDGVPVIRLKRLEAHQRLDVARSAHPPLQS